jgi:hypothetical protein
VASSPIVFRHCHTSHERNPVLYREEPQSPGKKDPISMRFHAEFDFPSFSWNLSPLFDGIMRLIIGGWQMDYFQEMARDGGREQLQPRQCARHELSRVRP